MEKLSEFRDLVHARLELEDQQRATMALMLRACHKAIARDVRDYSLEKQRKNIDDRNKALAALLTLADMLEKKEKTNEEDTLRPGA